MNYSPLIYAFEQENIAVTGTGTLDGNADAEHWWPWKGRDPKAPDAPNQLAARARLIEMGAKGVPVAERVFGEGSYLRPNFVQPYRCKNVLIEGVTIVNSPMWELHPVLCTQRHRPQRHDQQPRSQQRRLRSRVLPRRADRGLHVRHRRRLHRHQVGPQRRRPPRQRPDRERHRPQLHDEGRPRRRRDRQRDLGRRAQRLRRELPHGQPAARPGAAHQDQLGARRA